MKVNGLTLGSIGIRVDDTHVPKGKFSCMRCGTPIKRPRSYTDACPTGGLCRDCHSLHDPLISKWKNQ